MSEGIRNKDLLSIRWVNIKEIKPNPKNPRVHPQKAINNLVKSIEKFGWTNPIIITPDNLILAGHARYKAATQLKLKEVPVISLDVAGDDIDLYTIADNKLQEGTLWDEAKLGEMIQGIMENNEDMIMELEDIGFSPIELDNILSDFEDLNERVVDDFPEMGDTSDSEYVCPKCGYEWSGKPK